MAARNWNFFLNFGLFTSLYAVVVTAILCLVFWQTPKGDEQLKLRTMCGFWTYITWFFGEFCG
jgi:hypothetical protein